MRRFVGLIAWMCAAAIVPRLVSAVMIPVTTTSDTIANDGVCSLREAVIAANTDTASGGSAGECAAGSGADDIVLPAGTYTLTIGGPGEDAAATGDLDIIGGTLSITGASATSTFIDGNAADRVIDITSAAATLNLSDLTVRNGDAFEAAGIQNDGTLVIDAVALSGNASAVDGGAIGTSGTLTIANSTISGNTADGNGGGIDINDGTVTLRNCTISGNFAGDDGGGLDQADGVTTLSNVTITGNTADGGDGGGFAQAGGTLTIRNSIVGHNTDTDGEAPDCDGDPISQGYNLIENTALCTITGALTGNITGQNPLLGALQNNGGATSTRALLTGSPAIDAGNPAAPGNGGTTCEATDQRGSVRPLDGNADSTARCDMGAFEVVPPATPTPTQTPTMTNTIAGTVLPSTPTPTISPTATITPTPALDPNLCYVAGQASNTLVSVNKRSRAVRTIATITGATDIQALALSLAGKTLYAAAGGQLGTIDLATGVFTPTSSPFGTGDGANGLVTFDMVTGLAFDSKTGAFYGVHHDDLDEDILFRIDPLTGAFVPLAFEDGTEDYVPISGCQDDVEDIAVDKRSGEIFAITNTDETDDELSSIEIDTGDCTTIGSLEDANGDPVEDMGGLSFHNDGKLYGTTAAESDANSDKFWRIDKETAEATLIAALPAGGDDESLACPFAGCLPLAKVHHAGLPAAGETIAYRFKWMNRCDGLPATGVVVTDTLPSDVEFVSVTSAVPVQVTGNRITFSVGTLLKNPAGLATVYVRIKPTVGVGRFIQNEVVLTDALGRQVSSVDKFRVK